jgi:inositol oxygenase
MGTAHQLEQWDDFVGERYDPNRKTEDFRKFDDSAPAGVREFYRENHAKQTREFAQGMKRKYGAKTRGEMGIWEACEFLNTLVDESDPDTDLSQIQHLMQPPRRSAATATHAG